MARDYGRVKTKFWDNEDIKGCSPAAKMMALYLLTSQHSNAIGLYRLPVAYMQDDTGLTKDEIIQAFSELRAIGFVAWCERMPWIWICHYLKHNKPENPNVWRKCVKELQSVPGECLESVESVAADLSQIAREPRMMREHGGISADEITVLKQYRNRIGTVVPDKNNHGAGLMPLSLPIPTPEPEPIPQPKRKKPSAKGASAPDVPGWIPETCWKNFSEMRHKIRKPLTARAAELAIAKLERFKAEGLDIAAILDQSILNCWQDLWPPKINGHGQSEAELIGKVMAEAALRDQQNGEH